MSSADFRYTSTGEVRSTSSGDVRVTGDGNVFAGSTSLSFVMAAAMLALVSGTADAAITTAGDLQGQGQLVGTTSSTVTPGTVVLVADGKIQGSSSLDFSTSGLVKGSGVLAGSSAVTLEATASAEGRLFGDGSLSFSMAIDPATLAGAGWTQAPTSFSFATSGNLYDANQGGYVSLVFDSTGTLIADGALVGAAELGWFSTAALVGDAPITGSADPVSLVPAGELSASGELQATSAIDFLPSTVALVADGKLLGTSSLELAAVGELIGRVAIDSGFFLERLKFTTTGELVPPMTVEPFGTSFALTGEGYRIRSGQGASSLGFTAGPAAYVAFVETTGATTTSFSATGTMIPYATSDASTSLSLGLDGALTGRGNLKGSAALYVPGMGTLIARKAIQASTPGLTLAATGRMIGQKLMTGFSSNLVFSASGGPLVSSQGQKFRDLWVTYRVNRQKLIDQLHAKHRTELVAEATARQALTTRVTTVEGGVAANSNSITSLTATVGTKTSTFIQATEPAGSRVQGDIWIHTGQNNRMYIWDTGYGGWKVYNVDAGITVFVQPNQPVGNRAGDLWFDTDDGNLQYLFNGAGWVPVWDTRIDAHGTAINSLNTSVSNINGQLSSQSSSITELQSTIGTKTTTFVQDEPPSTTGRVTGDTWIDTNDSNKIYTWNGSWVLRNLDAGIVVFVQPDTPPASGRRAGDLWYETDENNKPWVWVVGTGWTAVQDPRTAANASAISTLNTNVSDINGTLTSQGNSITSLQNSVNDPNTGLAANASAITQLRTSATTSPNLLANTTFKSNTAEWLVAVNAGDANWGGLVRNLAGSGYQIPLVNNVGMTHPGTPASGQLIAFRNTAMPVKPGQRYGGQCLLAQHRFGHVYATLEFYNSAGNYVGGGVLQYNAGTEQNPNMIHEVGSGFSGGTGRSGWAHVSNFYTAPATAAYCHIFVAGVTNGQGTPYVWMCEPMVEVASVDRTKVSPYAPGGMEAMASYTLRLDVNGHVVGWQFNNDGTTGSMVISADHFAIAHPSSGTVYPFEVKNGNTYIKNAFIENLTIGRLTNGTLNADMLMGTGRIIFDQGGYMKIQGIGFGSNNQFLEWFGPRQPSSGTINTALCTETNAIQYLKTNGNAYFGGTLAVGVLKNSVQSSQISTTAQVETGNFSSNGGQRVVTYSLNYQNNGGNQTSIGNGSNSATVSLQRSVNGGSWTTLASFTAGGNYSSIYNAELGYWETNSSCSGSATYTDNSGGLGPINYRVVISSPSGAWPYTTDAQGFSQGTQSLTVTSLEQ